ncbi:MAG: ferredoxin family protein [Oscillibacter sp.]|nr:ferredoxin family protein [Oscillibacter sp.]
MSVRIDPELCVGCGQCAELCPGNLIERDAAGAAFLPYPADCWGCASCLKACPAGAIAYFLGPDIGGLGASMRVRSEGPLRHWRVERPGQSPVVVTVDSRSANQY